MWLEAMRQTEQRVYGFGSLKDVYALVGIHLRKQKCCLKKGTTSYNNFIFKNFFRIFHSRTVFSVTGLQVFTDFSRQCAGIKMSTAQTDFRAFCIFWFRSMPASGILSL